MFGKLSFLVLAVFTFTGYCVTEIWLQERNIEYVQNDILAVNFGIAKAWWDTLEECHVIIPGGTRYEAYPNSNLPSYIEYDAAVAPFNSCDVSMRGIGVEKSGTYELLSLIRHSADNTQSLIRQRYNLVVKTVDLFPHSEK